MAPGTRSSKDAAKATNASSTNGNENTHSNDIKNSNKSDNKENAGQPLGPPPRPQAADGDYFQGHSQNNPSYQAEPNPFEAQFGSTSADTPGKLPSVAALTSPSSLLPNETPSWSLRSGPLSPAMLAGPTGAGDYFDGSFSRNGFPTPNESSLRTGLTPGGTGSMFPMTSPSGGTPMFSTTLNGMPTPNTLDFFKTNANSRTNGVTTTNGPTSQPIEATTQGMDLKVPATAQATGDTYNHPDADAANGLFMLAQSNGVRSNNSFAVPTTLAGGAVQPTEAFDGGRTRSQKNGMNGNNIQQDDDDDDDDSDESEEQIKPATRSRGKRQSEPIRPTTRRKATGDSSRNNKRQKVMDKDDEDDDDELLLNGKDPKKMTDEEKRKNFLERNRVAALKCRQRKKQWLQNLQAKVDLYSQENDALTQSVNMLRDYIGQLRSVLLQHKDCPVTLSHQMGQHHLMAMLTQDGPMMPFQTLPPGAGVGQAPMALPMMDQRANGRL